MRTDQNKRDFVVPEQLAMIARIFVATDKTRGLPGRELGNGRNQRHRLAGCDAVHQVDIEVGDGRQLPHGRAVLTVDSEITVNWPYPGK